MSACDGRTTGDGVDSALDGDLVRCEVSVTADVTLRPLVSAVGDAVIDGDPMQCGDANKTSSAVCGKMFVLFESIWLQLV